jgi:hypothetical protein
LNWVLWRQTYITPPDRQGLLYRSYFSISRSSWLLVSVIGEMVKRAFHRIHSFIEILCAYFNCFSRIVKLSWLTTNDFWIVGCQNCIVLSIKNIKFIKGLILTWLCNSISNCFLPKKSCTPALTFQKKPSKVNGF